MAERLDLFFNHLIFTANHSYRKTYTNLLFCSINFQGCSQIVVNVMINYVILLFYLTHSAIIGYDFLEEFAFQILVSFPSNIPSLSSSQFLVNINILVLCYYFSVVQFYKVLLQILFLSEVFVDMLPPRPLLYGKHHFQLTFQRNKNSTLLHFFFQHLSISRENKFSFNYGGCFQSKPLTYPFVWRMFNLLSFVGSIGLAPFFFYVFSHRQHI